MAIVYETLRKRILYELYTHRCAVRRDTGPVCPRPPHGSARTAHKQLFICKGRRSTRSVRLYTRIIIILLYYNIIYGSFIKNEMIFHKLQFVWSATRRKNAVGWRRRPRGRGSCYGVGPVKDSRRRRRTIRTAAILRRRLTRGTNDSEMTARCYHLLFRQLGRTRRRGHRRTPRTNHNTHPACTVVVAE